MSSAVIIENGEFPRKEYPRELIRRADRIVCCDRGLEAFLRHRGRIFSPDSVREPDIVIGDMDSLRPSLQQQYSKILIHNTGQEDNDQTKAFRYILEHEPEVDAIHILAATGKREDHTIGNLSLLMEYAREYGACGIPAGDSDRNIYVDMVSDHSIAFALKDNLKLLIRCTSFRNMVNPF
jgi:thiamine pyrophosphokinase